MGIRTKIALGFMLLTIIVVSLVSFWGAQSLGFTVDSSDLIHLEGIKKHIVKQLAEQQNKLNYQAAEMSQAIDSLGLNNLINNQQFIQVLTSLKENLQLEYAEVFTSSKPLTSPSLVAYNLEKTNGNITRLAPAGPLSYSGYLISESKIKSNTDSKIIIAKKPEIKIQGDEIYCIFDNKGLLAAKGFIANYAVEKLISIKDSESTKQIKQDTELFRLRSFTINPNLYIITGYSAQVATLARSEINSMMLKLALLEIVGFLILGYFWAKKIFAPIKTLQDSIDNVSDGKWQEIPQAMTENSYQEIQSVAQSFNQMINQLSVAKENLIDAQKKLAAKDKMATLGRFSAGIAHEINNPLGTILMSAGMIKESLENQLPIEQEDVTVIIDEVKRCRDIIENLRTYTHKTEPNLICYSFQNFFEDSKKIISQQFSDNMKQISFSFEDSFNSFIKVDKNAMMQVFNNLIKNAIEASSDENIPIKVAAKANNDDCIISITDKGKGFGCDPEHIFEPLFTTKAQGTGLGLVICQAIIEGHHGTIRAERIEEKSETSFIFSLPKAKPETEGE